MDEQQQNLPMCKWDNGWCTYEAVDSLTIIVQISFFAILFLYAFKIIQYNIILIQYRRDSQLKYLFGWQFVLIFALLTFWLISSFTKSTIGFIVYRNYIDNSMQAVYRQSPIVVLSAIYEMFVSFASYCLILILIIIPYQWVKTVLDYLKNVQNQVQISMQMHKRIRYIYSVLKFIRIYAIFRACTVVFFIVESILIIHTQNGCKLPYYYSIYFICESSMLLIFYLFGYRSIRKMKQQKLFPIKAQDFRRIRRQYLLLLTVLVMRICYHTFLRFTDFYEYEPSSNCTDKGEDASDHIKRMVLMIIDHGVMHLMAVAVMIYVYRPNVEQRKRDQSILSTIAVL